MQHNKGDELEIYHVPNTYSTLELTRLEVLNVLFLFRFMEFSLFSKIVTRYFCVIIYDPGSNFVVLQNYKKSTNSFQKPRKNIYCNINLVLLLLSNI